jgi:hypothetical protein
MLHSSAIAVHRGSGTPYVCYLEDGQLKLAVRPGTAWSYYDLPTPSVNQVFDPALEVDALGYAHVAVTVETGGVFKMSYGYWDGPVTSQFHYQILYNSQLGYFGSGASPNLCVRSDGSVAIGYRGGDYPSYQIHVAENGSLGGTAWAIQVIAHPSYECYSPFILATLEDDLHLTFSGNMGFGLPSYIFYTYKAAGSSAWTGVQTASNNPLGGNPKMVVDGNGSVHIAFDEVAGNFYTGNISYTSNQSGTWSAGHLVTGDKAYPSFVMDKAGNGSISLEHLLSSKDSDIYYYGFVVSHGLSCDITELSQSTGGTGNFTLNAGSAHANRNYLLFGNVYGVYPGTPLPGGKVTLPLNWDLFTNAVILYVNSPAFKDFLGTLDGSGSATAQLNAGPIPGAAGVLMHFAYALNSPWNFVSNPWSIEIVP